MTNIPFINDTYINESKLITKIDSYHFFKKKYSYAVSKNEINYESIYKTLKTLSSPDEKLFFINLQNSKIDGINESLKKYINIEYFDDNYIKIIFNNDYFFSSPSNLNIVLLDIDFQGTLEFNSNGGCRTNTNNTFENSINLLHYKLHNNSQKAFYIFNFENINNNPIDLNSGHLKEGKKLPVFFNYYNLNQSSSNNYQDNNFIFNLSVPTSISFFQAENKKSILKNNVIVNTLKNKFINEETIINVNYFHSISTEQHRDDAFEINHLVPNFTSNIKYLCLNKGIAASQINSFIDTKAPKSKSHQHLKHILLNENSISYSKPNLMIENPDVESSHGNSIGGLNKEHLIYLQQRGINEEKSKNILAQSAIDNFSETKFFSSIIKNYFQKKEVSNE